MIGDDGDEPIVFSKFNYAPAGNVEMMRLQGTGLDNNVRVGINTNGTTANSTLQVNGSVTMSAVRINSALTLTEAHHTVIITGGTGGITLPPANSCTGRIYVVKNLSGSVITISNFISSLGASATSIANNRVVMIQSDGVDWQQIN